MNKHLLKAKIAENGDTQTQLACAMGMGASNFSDRINGKIPFRQNEIAFIRNRYHLTAQEVDLIFFDLELSEKDKPT